MRDRIVRLLKRLFPIIGVLVFASFFVVPLNRVGHRVWEALNYSLDTSQAKGVLYFCAVCLAVLCFASFQRKRRWINLALLLLFATIPLLIRDGLGFKLPFPLDIGFVVPAYFEFWLLFTYTFLVFFLFTELEEENVSDSSGQEFFQSDTFSESVSQAILERIGDRKVYAITGKWGAGKTYAMNKVVSILESKENEGRCYCRLISNYAYTSLDEFLAETVAGLSGQLESKDLSAFLHAMPSQFEFSRISISSLGRIQLALDRLSELKNFKVKTGAYVLSKPVVLIYDDIDRLNKEQVSILYRGLHLVSQIDKVSVLLCQNNGQIESLYDDIGNQMDSFQEKYIDERFEIPEPTIAEYKDFFDSELSDVVTQDGMFDQNLSDCIRITKSFISPRRIQRISTRVARINQIAGTNVLSSEIIIIAFLYELNTDFTHYILSNVKKYRKSYVKVINSMQVTTNADRMNLIRDGRERVENANLIKLKLGEDQLTQKYGQYFEQMQLQLWELLLEGKLGVSNHYLSIRNDQRTHIYSRLLTPTISFDESIFQTIWAQFKSIGSLSKDQSESLSILGVLSRISYFPIEIVRKDFNVLVRFVAELHSYKVSNINEDIFSNSFEDSSHFANWMGNDIQIWEVNNVIEILSKLLINPSKVIQLFAARIVGEINRGNYTDKSDIREFLTPLNDEYDKFLLRIFEDIRMDAFKFECISLSTQIDESQFTTPGKGGGVHKLRPTAKLLIKNSITSNGLFQTWKYCIRTDGDFFYPNWLADLYFVDRHILRNSFTKNLTSEERFLLKLFGENGRRPEPSELERRQLKILFHSLVGEGM